MYSPLWKENGRATSTMTATTATTAWRSAESRRPQTATVSAVAAFVNPRLIQRNGIPFTARYNPGDTSFMKNYEKKLFHYAEIWRKRVPRERNRIFSPLFNFPVQSWKRILLYPKTKDTSLCAHLQHSREPNKRFLQSNTYETFSVRYTFILSFLWRRF